MVDSVSSFVKPPDASKFNFTSEDGESRGDEFLVALNRFSDDLWRQVSLLSDGSDASLAVAVAKAPDTSVTNVTAVQSTDLAVHEAADIPLEEGADNLLIKEATLTLLQDPETTNSDAFMTALKASRFYQQSTQLGLSALFKIEA